MILLIYILIILALYGGTFLLTWFIHKDFHEDDY